MGAYVGFNLKTLSYGMHAFTTSPRVPSESTLDQSAFIKSIFDQVKHQISGKQDEYDAALRRMQELLNAAEARQPDGAAPQSGQRPASQHTAPAPAPEAPQEARPEAPQEAPPCANAGQAEAARPAQAAEPARDGHDQEQARRQREHRHAVHLRRTHEQTGRDNALSLLGGHAAPGSHDSFGNHGTQAGGVDAALLEEIRGLREAFEASAGQRPSRTDTDNG